MSDIRVEPLVLPRDTRRMLDCWEHIYRDDPHWVPPLRIERRRFFDPDRNPYFRVADVACFLATRGGTPVGTIAATVDHLYQEREPGTGFFGFFEFVDDTAVAEALFDAAAGWLRERGMQRVLGPSNFNTNHEFGLLVDGFDSDPCIANLHNSAYFVDVYAKLGFEKAMDWYAYWIDATAVPRSLERIAARVESRHPELRVRPLERRRLRSEIDLVHEIYDDAWEDNWGHVRVSREEFHALGENFGALIDPGLCWLVESEGRPVAVSITFPDLNPLVKRMRGRLLPFGWLHFALGRRRFDGLRVFILGVKREFQHLPLGSVLYARTWRRARELGVRGGEASLILENNYRMRGAIEKMGGRVTKTYRTYQRHLEGDLGSAQGGSGA
ncbi:MAG: N-acetyltransferase [Proteobacteria bacterium]|nr:N-acetyltransferase [Pseudomonadota bacterium]